jgi:hypothetical protein
MNLFFWVSGNGRLQSLRALNNMQNLWLLAVAWRSFVKDNFQRGQGQHPAKICHWSILQLGGRK